MVRTEELHGAQLYLCDLNQEGLAGQIAKAGGTTETENGMRG